MRTQLEPDPFTSEPPAEEPAKPQAPAPIPTASIRAAREEIRLQGMVATLPPDAAQIVLGREGGKLAHRGTTAVRGPCAPTWSELLGLGLTEAQACALEFVLAWFGAPFDAVTSEASEEGGLRWGAWQLSGTALSEALGRWKQREPAAFEARLGRLGVDVAPGQSPESPSLTLLDVERGETVGGRQALSMLGEDPRLLAALAQAGRERGAQLAQLAHVIEHILRPMLDSSEEGASRRASPTGPFSTPRALALLFYTELRLGRRGVARLVAHTHQEAKSPVPGEQAGLVFAADLHSAGRAREAAEVRRILSSPELAVRPA